MSSQKLLVIVSVTAGKQNAVVEEIKTILDAQKRQYKLAEISAPEEIDAVLKSVTPKNYAAVIVYGGDGTVVAAVKKFGKTQLPILVLPGGTANMLAKYLGLPATVKECLDLYLSSTLITERVDIATVNNEPLVLDMHAGWWSESIKQTPRKLKKRVGPSAYAWTALKKISKAPLQKYEFTLNDKKSYRVDGYTFIVGNQGNQNVLGLSIFPRDHAPGMVQMAVIKSVKAGDLIKWFVRRFFGRNTPSVIEMYRSKKIVISKSPKYILADDDAAKVSLPITIIGGEYTAKLFAPPAKAQINPVVKAYRWLRLWVHRLALRMRTITNRNVSIRYSHVAPNLYLGGKYPSSTYSLFREWGITGVVSMRRTASSPAPADIEVLHLPTQDWTPPTLKNLQKGAEFINQKIEQGGSVYVHCRLGEGRGPTMAAAYLISTGLTVDEALIALAKYRPVARPNARQRKRLAQLQQFYNA